MSRVPLSICWCLLLGIASAIGADGFAPAPTRVGSLGQKEALILQGNKSFNLDQIWDGLAWHIDFLAAAHPAAPLTNYTTTLLKLLRAGYLREGFPDVDVTVTPDFAARRISVSINEGPRFFCGDIRVTGLKADDNTSIIREITRGVTATPGLDKKHTNFVSSPWVKGASAPFDQTARNRLNELVVQTLARLNYYQPKLNLTVTPQPGRGIAELHIDILDPGLVGKITRIEITGNTNNPTDQVLRYLDLAEGMESHALLLNTISNRLSASARFMRHACTLSPLNKPGQLKLQIELLELDDAPTLDQPLAPDEQALVNLADWVRDWSTRPEQLVFIMGTTSQWFNVRTDFALSQAGAALLVRGGPASFAQGLLYGGVFSSEQFGLYSGWRARNFISNGSERSPRGFIRYTVQPENPIGDQFHLTFGMGFGSEPGPFEFDISLTPAAMLDMAHRDWVKTITNGILTMTTPADADDTALFKVDIQTGRLIEMSAQRKKLSLQLRFQTNAFESLVRNVQLATANYLNDYQTNKPLSSLIAFAASDLLQNPFLNLLTNNPAVSADVLQALQLGSSRWFRDPRFDLVKIFTPLETLVWGPGTNSSLGLFDFSGNTNVFGVPLDDVFENRDSAANLMAVLGTLGIKNSDRLWPRESWARTLTRELGFIIAGRTQYSEAELKSLARGTNMGPLASLLAAETCRKFYPPLCSHFAARGFTNLTLAEFEKDVRALIREPSAMTQVFSNFLHLLPILSQDDVNILSKQIPGDTGLFVSETIDLLRAGGNKPIDQALHSAFEHHWDKVMKPRLLARLDTLLPPHIDPVTPQGQFTRALMYFVGRGVEKNPEVGLKWLTKAADGHLAEAYDMLGSLHESTSPITAAIWYQKAVEAKYPHAACKLGLLYARGRPDFPANKTAAEKWFRLEAESGCAKAQFYLGILVMPDEGKKPGPGWEECTHWLHKAAAQEHSEAQYTLGMIYETTNTVEGLKWYRLAAENGLPKAQERLADKLSDGFSATPDYPEAYHWFSLAAAQGDRVAQASANRILRKLNPEQAKKAIKRADRAIARQRQEKARNSE